MYLISRRHFLGGSTALLCVAGCGIRVNDSALAIPSNLEDLVLRLEQATPWNAVTLIGDEIAAGTSLDTLYLATLIVCCRQLDFAQLGFDSHPLWTLYSARVLGDRGDDVDEGLALIHVVDRFKGYQKGRAPKNAGTFDEASLMSVEDATLQLPEALETFDANAADAAAVSLFRAGAVEALEQGFVRGGLRSLGNIGHALIHASQTLRTGRRIGLAEAAVRTIAFGLCTESGADAGVLTPWQDNRERIKDLTEGWDEGAYEPAEVAGLLPALRVSGASSTSEVALAHLVDGGSVQALREACFARASELGLAHRDQRGIFPALHTVTGADACVWLADATADPEVRKLAALQLAALVGSNDEEAQNRTGGPGDPVALDELQPRSGATSRDVLDALSEDRVEATRALLGMSDPLDIIEDQRRILLDKAYEDHHFKLPVAAWERAEAAYPAVRPWVLAGALGWGLTPADGDWPMLDRAREALAR